METENQNNQNVRLCDLCGERPAAVDVMFVAGGERRNGGLCEQCARDAMTQQQLGGGLGVPGRGPGRSTPDGDSPALVDACARPLRP